MRKPLWLDINGEPIRLFDTASAAQYLCVTRGTFRAYLNKGRYLKKAGEINRGFVFTQGQLDECRQRLNLERKEINVEYAK